MPDENRDIARVLARTAVFGAASAATRDRLAGHASIVRLKRGQAVLRQGDAWPYVGIVGDGELTFVAASDNGREHVLFQVHAGEPFGDLAALDGGPALGTATVSSPRGWIVCIPRPVLDEELRKDIRLLHGFAVLSVRRSRVLAERLTAQVAKTVVSRLAAMLLAYASEEPGLRAPRAGLPRLVQLAVAVGTVPEVVSRSFARFERAGALERGRHGVTRIDRERLGAFL